MKERRYGDLPDGSRNTIHESRLLDVETYKGQVVAVWFRCKMLRFSQSEVDYTRAADLFDGDSDEVLAVVVPE